MNDILKSIGFIPRRFLYPHEQEGMGIDELVHTIFNIDSDRSKHWCKGANHNLDMLEPHNCLFSYLQVDGRRYVIVIQKRQDAVLSYIYIYETDSAANLSMDPLFFRPSYDILNAYYAVMGKFSLHLKNYESYQ